MQPTDMTPGKLYRLTYQVGEPVRIDSYTGRLIELRENGDRPPTAVFRDTRRTMGAYAETWIGTGKIVTVETA